jgi:hypothetical protein
MRWVGYVASMRAENYIVIFVRKHCQKWIFGRTKRKLKDNFPVTYKEIERLTVGQFGYLSPFYSQFGLKLMMK